MLPHASTEAETGAPTGLGPLAGGEIAVVGGGLVGVCTAYRLAQRGARVTLVDDGTAPSASDVSFAWLNAFAKFPRGYGRLNASGLGEYRQLQVETGTPFVVDSGSLRWALDPAGAGALAQDVRQMQAWGTVVEEGDAAGLAALEPGLRVPDGVGTIYRCPGDGWLDSRAALPALRRTARARWGLVEVEDRVVDLRPTDGSAHLLLASGRALRADLVVLAVGTGVPALAARVGMELPVGAQRSVLLVTEPTRLAPGHVVNLESIWFRRESAGGLLIGSSLLPQQAEQVTEADVTAVLDQLAAVLPGADRLRVTEIREGEQPVPGDGYPIVGHDPRHSSVYYAVSRSGASVAPALARLIAADLTDDQPDLNPYRPDRFGTRLRAHAGPPGEQ